MLSMFLSPLHWTRESICNSSFRYGWAILTDLNIIISLITGSKIVDQLNSFGNGMLG